MLTDHRLRETLGPDARFVHIDISTTAVPVNRPIGRQIRRLLESAPSSRMAFGTFFITDASGTTLYGVRPCACRRHGTLRTAADLQRLAARPELWPDPNLDLETVRAAMERFGRHKALREAAAAGADPLELQQFEAALPDDLALAWPCRMVDDARIATLTLGLVDGSGGNAPGLARTLDPRQSGSHALRMLLSDGLAEAALREGPCHAAAGPHLALTYLLLARHGIEAAVQGACRRLGATPADVPLHELPIPLAARERAARLACAGYGIEIAKGGSALDALRRSLT